MSSLELLSSVRKSYIPGLNLSNFLCTEMPQRLPLAAGLKAARDVARKDASLNDGLNLPPVELLLSKSSTAGEQVVACINTWLVERANWWGEWAGGQLDGGGMWG